MNVVDAAHGTVHDYPGGAAALAARFITRAGGSMSPAVLNSKVDPGKDTHHLTLAEADKLMAFTADYRVLHALAANHGHVAVQTGSETPACDMAILEIIARAWASNGDVGAAVNDALSDGRIERHEVERVRRAIYPVQMALQQLVMRLEEMAE